MNEVRVLIGLLVFCVAAIVIAIFYRVQVLQDYKRMPWMRHVSLRLRQRDFLRAMRERKEEDENDTD